MGKQKKKAKQQGSTIAQNRRARHDYFLEEKVEAGLVLTGWEVKALRASRGQLTDSFVQFDRNGEAWLHGAQIQPLTEASTHFVTDPTRPRKLLMHERQLAKFSEAKDQKGYTVVVTAMYWKNHLVKCEVALARGKQLHDKRQSDKERDWNLTKQRVMRAHND